MYTTFNMRNCRCDKNYMSASSLRSSLLCIAYCCTLLFSNVMCANVYSPHNIRYKSKPHNHVSHVSTYVPGNLNVRTRTNSYENQSDDSVEDGDVEMGVSLLKSSEHKVQRQLLKDMGLTKVPNTKHVSCLFSYNIMLVQFYK